jgi:hypothetical protein
MPEIARRVSGVSILQIFQEAGSHLKVNLSCACCDEFKNIGLCHMTQVAKTNDPQLKTWMDVPPGSDFPIQNLPFGIFKTRYLTPVAGVAIGDHVMDLVYLHENGYLDGQRLL